VKATLADGSQLTGRVAASDDTGVTIDDSGAERRLAYDDIVKALVQVEFNRKTKEA
jgi:ribosome maturation factor RimP